MGERRDHQREDNATALHSQVFETVPDLEIRRRGESEIPQSAHLEDDRCIHLLGYVPHDELPDILRLADLFVLPSFYESYVMDLVEAMTCGCPIVASQTGACPEITAGAALFADPNDPSDFARKIEQLALDDRLQVEMREKSLERAEFFNWERSARVVMTEIKQVIAKPPKESSKSG